MKQPNLGDIVIYTERGIPKAAIIVGVVDDETVDLSVFSSTYCGSKLRPNVPFSKGEIDGTWKWRGTKAR